jgi:dTDP-4-dehydrorhamnose reductase
MSTDRVLITGAGGMLGNAIYPYFSSRYSQLTATDKDVNESWLEFLDVRDTLALKQAFASIRPTLVLHLAACTDLEFCEVQIDTARETNADATGEIARLCEEYSATLVYISTAGIFDGTQQDRPYVETDEARPIMVYGQTKFDGEKLTAKYCSRHFIVRAGWMVGGGARKDKKFVHHILGQILAGEKVLRAVNDRWGTPTYTHDFALNLFRLLDSRAYGTYHMVCEGSGTRYDVARAIIDITGHKDVDLLPVDSSYFEAKYFAPRPGFRNDGECKSSCSGHQSDASLARSFAGLYRARIRPCPGRQFHPGNPDRTTRAWHQTQTSIRMEWTRS